MNLKQLLAFLAAVLLALPASAQETPPASTRAPTAPAQPGAMEMRSMDKMASSVTKMSEMCRMMMEKEKAAMPYKIGAGILIGALLFVALVLFIVLEIQWIIYWSRLLKAQKRNVLSPSR